MTFTYQTTALSTGSAIGRKNAIRLFLKDTSSGSAVLQDEEIAFYLSVYANNVWRAGAAAADDLAAKQAESKSVGDLSISGLGKTWHEVAARLRLIADSRAKPYAGGLSVSDKETAEADLDRVEPFFSRTLLQNPLTGHGPEAATT